MQGIMGLCYYFTWLLMQTTIPYKPKWPKMTLGKVLKDHININLSWSFIFEPNTKLLDILYAGSITTYILK